MIVKITDYGKSGGRYFVDYEASGLSVNQLEFLDNVLDEETNVNGDVLNIRMYFDEKLYPFQSETAKFRLDDFIAREEIEMNVYLSSVIDDM